MPSYPNFNRNVNLVRWKETMSRYPEGYPTELFTEDVSAFECELCQCVVRDPLEHVACSQIYCADCVKLALAKMKPPACPHCMAPAVAADFKRVNRLLRQMLEAKQMRCVHFPECAHSTTFGTLEKHLAECQLETVACKFSGCNEQMLRRDAAQHEAACAYKTERCEFCEVQVLASTMQTHTQDFCHRAPAACKFCDICVPREEMPKHLAEACDKQPVKCVIEGCTHMMPKAEVQAHIDANLSGHLAQVQQQMLDMNKVVSEMKDEMTALRMALVQKDEAIAELRSQLQTVQQQQQSGGFPPLAPAAGFGQSSGFGGGKAFGQPKKKSQLGAAPAGTSGGFSFGSAGPNPFLSGPQATPTFGNPTP